MKKYFCVAMFLILSLALSSVCFSVQLGWSLQQDSVNYILDNYP